MYSEEIRKKTTLMNITVAGLANMLKEVTPLSP